jgi:hypothetical protein
LGAVLSAVVGPLSCWWLWYSAAVEQYRALQDLILSSLEALRFDVLKDLRIKLPEDLNKERELWQIIDISISNGEPQTLAYQHPQS